MAADVINKFLVGSGGAGAGEWVEKPGKGQSSKLYEIMRGTLVKHGHTIEPMWLSFARCAEHNCVEIATFDEMSRAPLVLASLAGMEGKLFIEKIREANLALQSRKAR